MEESEITTQKETVDNVCGKDRTNEATGEVSTQVSNPGSACNPTEEPETKYNRLKLFDKVMQKSLDKLIHHAR